MAAKNKKKNANEKARSSYFRGVKSEFKKVVWPTKKQILNYSTIVIVVSILFALLFSVYDKIIIFLLQQFIYR